MKNSFLLSSLALIIGVAIGYAISPRSKPEKPEPVVAQQSPEPSVSEYVEQIKSLRLENENLKASLAVLPKEIEPTVSAENVKKDLLESIINGDNISAAQAEMDRKQFNQLARSLNLTPDQIMQLEVLWDKRMKQMRLITQSRGLLSQEEQQSKYGDIMEFRFDNELKKMLTEEQVVVFDDNKQKQREAYSVMQSQRLLSDLQISKESSFSGEEHTAIQNAFQKAYSSSQKMEMPDSIKELNIRPDKKRVLTQCYADLCPELFEKVYQSIVQYESE